MKLFKSVAFLGLALGMLAYAVPRLHIGGGWTMSTVFGVVWICLALMIVSAHLHATIGVGEQTEERLRQVRRMRRWQTDRALQRKLRTMGARK